MQTSLVTRSTGTTRRLPHQCAHWFAMTVCEFHFPLGFKLVLCVGTPLRGVRLFGAFKYSTLAKFYEPAILVFSLRKGTFLKNNSLQIQEETK